MSLVILGISMSGGVLSNKISTVSRMIPHAFHMIKRPVKTLTSGFSQLKPVKKNKDPCNHLLAFTTVYNLLEIVFGILRLPPTRAGRSRTICARYRHRGKFSETLKQNRFPPLSGAPEGDGFFIRQNNLYQIFMIALPSLQWRILYWGS
jgi:hypothetical protein